MSFLGCLRALPGEQSQHASWISLPHLRRVQARLTHTPLGKQLSSPEQPRPVQSQIPARPVSLRSEASPPISVDQGRRQ